MTKLASQRDELLGSRRRLRGAADRAFGEWCDSRAEEVERQAIAPLIAGMERFEAELAAADEAFTSAERLIGQR